METQKASVKKIALTYGSLLALAGIVLSVLVYVLGMSAEQPWWQSLLGLVFMVTAIAAGFKTFKQEGDGYLSLGDAIKTGLAISLISGIISAIYFYVFINIIEPDFVAQTLDLTREKLIEQNQTQEQIDMAMGMTEKFMSPYFMVAMSLIMSLFFGFIVSLITGLIMKKDRPSFQ